METVVVGGGGLAGLVSALELRKAFNVVIVEKEAACGGLLRSFTNVAGVAFDYGTHVLSDTGMPELDRLLFDRLDSRGWNRFKVIRAGTHFAGQLYGKSAFIDARTLPKPLYDAAVRELLATDAVHPSDTKDLEEFLERHFGKTITEHVVAPGMRKQFAVPLRDMIPDNPFAPKRVVCFDAETSRELKKEPRLDAKIAFATNEEGVRETYHHYPREGGIGAWVDDLCADLAASGVRILNGRSVHRVHRRDGRAVAVELGGGDRIDCAHLVWTVPLFLLLKALGVEASASSPLARPVGLYHFVFDRPFLVDNHHVICYDERLKTFRVTLYPNLREDGGKGAFNCTVEVIGERSGDFSSLAGVVRDELVYIGVLSHGARVLSLDTEVVPVGFPALTHAFVEGMAQQLDAARAETSNALFLGRAKCLPFFMDHVMVEAFERSRELVTKGFP
jgi:glycine/D-amino acid oxidase-like deaminating enzyme